MWGEKVGELVGMYIRRFGVFGGRRGFGLLEGLRLP